MAAECFASIHLCRIRVTRLDTLGNPVAGPNNVYVTDRPLQLGITPVVETGEEKTLVGGCDCIVAEYKGTDKLKRFDLELDLATVEPALFEMLTGGSAILDAEGDPIGVWWQSYANCSEDQQPNVAFEAWQDLWEDDHQASGTPYLQWVFPSSRWQIGEQSLGNDFLQPKLTGFTRGNTLWGDGIFGDYPEAAEPLGGFFYTDEIPDAACGYRSFAIT